MKLLILDGNSILNRAFYGIKILTTSDGHFTNAIYGFMTTLKKIEDEINPDLVAVTFDLKEPTFRHKLSSGYKANRKGMPEELAEQLPVLKELLKYLGYKMITCPGFEADDIIGTLASKCDKEGHLCIIATGDRDSLQLITENVSVRLVSTRFGKSESVVFDEEKVNEVYGVSPKQLIEIKALQGDASDNIPGVKGVGEKTARMLIEKFESVDKIYNNIESLPIKESLKDKLLRGKESAYLSRTLGTIVKNVPINCEIKDYVKDKGDRAKAKELLNKLEFFSIIKKLGLGQEDKDEIQNKQGAESENTEVCIVENPEDIINEIKDCKELSFYSDYGTKDLKCAAIYFNQKAAIINDTQNNFDEFLKRIFEDESIKKNVYDIKRLIRLLNAKNIKALGQNTDIMLCAYVINPSVSDYSLESLCDKYCRDIISLGEKDLNESNKSFVSKVISIDKIAKEEISILKKNNQLELLNEIEGPLAEVLSNMEDCGFKVDALGLSKYGDHLGVQVDKLRSEIYSLCGAEFNINSPKQLGEVLFEQLCLPKGKKGKNGYSTSADVLEGLRNYHPIISMILDYRALTKLKSTYCDAMVKLVDKNERIHSNFNQTETRTGRISSTEPNLQNIPVRTEIGRELRKYFCAEKGYVLVDADYSQIELRVLAHISSDSNMIDAFKSNKDIHTITASQIFGVPKEMVTPEMRSRAKAVNFGIVYGIGAFSLSKDLGITRMDADRYIKNYLRHYSGVERYMKEVVDFAKNNGYVETVFKRRRYLPEISASNFNLRAFGERVARNMPIQGTAADIIKIAMIKVYNKISELKLKSRLILQVHDELIVEAYEDEVETVEKLLKEEMENAVSLSVPMCVHLSKGKTWYDAKD